MPAPPRIFDRRRMVLILWALLSAGFFTISLFGYQVSRQAIRDAIIGQDLPLTSSNIYSEIQKDLVRPVLISSTMANDTFLREWVMSGERDAKAMARYLTEIRTRYGAFASFFVSERTGNYYTGDGILKQVKPGETRDAWYYRVRDMVEPYEINVDPDLANRDALTIFINYRAFDFNGRYLGATGIGLTVESVRELIATYQKRFNRTIFFVDHGGRIVLFGNESGRQERDLRKAPGLGALVDQILNERTGSYQYLANGDNHIVHVNYLPELKWYLVVEQSEEAALAGVRKTFYTNLVISLFVTLVVMSLIHVAIGSYQERLETLASTDKLTGILNRHAFTILIDKLLAELRREPRPLALMLVDIDHFKRINDTRGHLAGDDVLQEVATRLQAGLRESDLAVRWGGEEFLLLLKGCDLAEAARIADKLRAAIAEHPVRAAGKEIDVTVSIGVAERRGDETPTMTIDRADAALYSAKHQGRDRVCIGDTASVT